MQDRRMPDETKSVKRTARFAAALGAAALLLLPAGQSLGEGTPAPTLTRTITLTPQTSAMTAVDLSYKFYGGGFHVLSLDTQAVITPQSYEIASQVQTEGIADTFFNGHMESQARGVMTPQGPRLLSYSQDYEGTFGERSVYMSRTKGGGYDVTAVPEDGVHAQGGLSDRVLEKTVDPLSASIFTALNKGGAPCRQVIPVFDGRRVFNLRFEPDGEDILEPSVEEAYAGPALRCKISYEAVAGYSQKWKIDEAKNPLKPFTVWIARFPYEGKEKGAGETLYVPVRLLIETRYINATAHLSRVVIDGMERVAAQHTP
ncbi:hypothetical protein M2A_1936 [Tepidicaulis marinus]|uniref:DUF3108 domain-containing protein n=2 Tax=Tepidicaulis marinus TaxID=1333998 RepID=A0A081BBL9_9HYPH|nr:hypothetical protein M2A_1936 [Tepidicaulis marinus]